MRGSLPSGWVVRKLGEVLSQVERPVRVDQNATYRMLGVRLYGNGGYVRETLAGRQMKASQLFRIEQGDFVYTRLFASKGTFALIGEALDGCHASSEFPCFQINVALVEPQYLRCYFMQPWVWRAIEGQSSGTTSGSRLRFNEKDLLRMRVPFPPLPEQRAIAEALQSVDEVIDRSRAVIEQLGQVKKALVQELLTRGLPGRHTRFKPTPVGEIPEEWEVAALPRVAQWQNGKGFPSDDYGDEGVKLLRPGNLGEDGRVVWDAEHTTHIPSAYAHSARSWLVGGREIIMNLTAQSLRDQFLGRVCMTDRGEHCLLNQRLARFTATACDQRFLFWSLKGPAFRHHIDRLPKGSKVQHIYDRDIETALLPLPSPDEQLAIASILDAAHARECSALDALPAMQTLCSALRQELLTGRRRWKGASITHAGGGD